MITETTLAQIHALQDRVTDLENENKGLKAQLNQLSPPVRSFAVLIEDWRRDHGNGVNDGNVSRAMNRILDAWHNLNLVFIGDLPDPAHYAAEIASLAMGVLEILQPTRARSVNLYTTSGGVPVADYGYGNVYLIESGERSLWYRGEYDLAKQVLDTQPNGRMEKRAEIDDLYRPTA